MIAGQQERIGLGEAVGRMIEEEGFPNRDISILANGYKLGIPVTVHVGIGHDIIHEHPNLDGGALRRNFLSRFPGICRDRSVIWKEAFC